MRAAAGQILFLECSGREGAVFPAGMGRHGKDAGKGFPRHHRPGSAGVLARQAPQAFEGAGGTPALPGARVRAGRPRSQGRGCGRDARAPRARMRAGRPRSQGIENARRPVSRVLSTPRGAGRPFIWDAGCPAPRATDPDGGAENRLGREGPAVPTWSCSRWGLPCPLRCRRSGALLPHPFTLACSRPWRGGCRRSAFCGTFPGVAPAGRYPAPSFRGARTFLPPPRRKAAVRPSGADKVAFRRPAVKACRHRGRQARGGRGGETLPRRRPFTKG